MSKRDAILARKTGEPPKKPVIDGDWAAMLAVVENLENRLAALESRPAPVDGKDGRDGVDGKDGEQGPRGERGEPGERGPVGADGRGFTTATQNERGELLLTMTDGSIVNVGVVRGRDGIDGKDGRDGINGQDGKDGINGRDGQDGVSVKAASIESDGTLSIMLSSGEIIDAGHAVGPRGQDGRDGVDGKDGADGVSIKAAVIDETGSLSLALTDGSTLLLGTVRGESGKDGAQGPQGEPGLPGVVDENEVARVAAQIVDRQVAYAVPSAIAEVEARMNSRFDGLFTNLMSLFGRAPEKTSEDPKPKRPASR